MKKLYPKNKINSVDPPIKITGEYLITLWKIPVKEAYYRENGKFYMVLDAFPGALCDFEGYILFSTEKEFLDCTYLKTSDFKDYKRNRTNVKGKGICEIPGYHKGEPPFKR